MTWEQIIALSNLHAARQMEVAVGRLDAIITRLDLLGREGLHEVVKEMARDARAQRKRRLARRRAKR